MSNIDCAAFCILFAEALDTTSQISPVSDLGDIEEYDSMGKINISLLIEDVFEFQIDYEILDDQKTVQDIFNYCIAEANASGG